MSNKLFYILALFLLAFSFFSTASAKSSFHITIVTGGEMMPSPPAPNMQWTCVRFNPRRGCTRYAFVPTYWQPPVVYAPYYYGPAPYYYHRARHWR